LDGGRALGNEPSKKTVTNSVRSSCPGKMVVADGGEKLIERGAEGGGSYAPDRHSSLALSTGSSKKREGKQRRGSTKEGEEEANTTHKGKQKE